MTALTEEVDRAWALISAGRDKDVIESGRRILALLSHEPTLITPTVHPLGFVHGKLAARNSGTIRLHLWPDPPIPPQDPPWQVHRHNWPLRSYVLSGAVTNREYEVRPDSRGSKQLYAVEYDEYISRLRDTGKRVSCRMVSENTYKADSSYKVPVDVFHATEATAGHGSATLAVAGETTPSPPLVLGTADGNPEYAFERSQFPLFDLERILKQLVQ